MSQESGRRSPCPRTGKGFEFNRAIGNCGVGYIYSHNEELALYSVVLDNTVEVVLRNGDLSAIYPTTLPICRNMWAFKMSHDNFWLRRDGIATLSKCGFRVYRSNEFGYFFGFDNAEDDPYLEHWIPLYRLRGYQWHTNLI